MNEQPIKFKITPGLPPPYNPVSFLGSINSGFPHDAIRDRLSEIGYLPPETSKQAMENTRTIFLRLRQGHLMISRKAESANGDVGIFTLFVEKKIK